MITGQGSTTDTLDEDAVRELLAQGLDGLALDGKRVLVIIPDGHGLTILPFCPSSLASAAPTGPATSRRPSTA